MKLTDKQLRNSYCISKEDFLDSVKDETEPYLVFIRFRVRYFAAYCLTPQTTLLFRCSDRPIYFRINCSCSKFLNFSFNDLVLLTDALMIDNYEMYFSSPYIKS